MSSKRGCELYERVVERDAAITALCEEQRLALGLLIANPLGGVLPHATQVRYFTFFEDDTWHVHPNFHVLGAFEQDVIEGDLLDETLRPVGVDEWAGYLERACSPVGPWSRFTIAVPSGMITTTGARSPL